MEITLYNLLNLIFTLLINEILKTIRKNIYISIEYITFNIYNKEININKVLIERIEEFDIVSL